MAQTRKPVAVVPPGLTSGPPNGRGPFLTADCNIVPFAPLPSAISTSSCRRSGSALPGRNADRAGDTLALRRREFCGRFAKGRQGQAKDRQRTGHQLIRAVHRRGWREDTAETTQQNVIPLRPHQCTTRAAVHGAIDRPALNLLSRFRKEGLPLRSSFAPRAGWSPAPLHRALHRLCFEPHAGGLRSTIKRDLAQGLSRQILRQQSADFRWLDRGLSEHRSGRSSSPISGRRATAALSSDRLGADAIAYQGLTPPDG